MLVQYIPLYTEEQRNRHKIRPGLTGYAQVNGRNAISWKERFDLDLKYVKNISMWLDVKILFKTVFAVFNRKGICSETSVTMEEFKGEENDG